MKKQVIAVALATAVLCSVLWSPNNTEYHDRCHEQDLFFACVNALPTSAKGTVGWTAMVDDCQIKAEQQSVTNRENVPEGCLW